MGDLCIDNTTYTYQDSSSNNGDVGYYAKHVYSEGEGYLHTTDDGFVFYDDGTNIYLVQYNGNLIELTLPANYNGKNYEIYQYAFYNCSSLTSVTIPDSVTSIGGSAFSGCSALESITIPFVGAKAGVTASNTSQHLFGYIFGTSSYTGGTATTQNYNGSSDNTDFFTIHITYYIPASLKSVTVTGGNILYGAFRGCTGLTSITIGNGVTSIGKNAFDGCSSLTSITIPDSVTSIGYRAFSGCTGLTSITIGNGVTSIGEYAFYNCTGLTSITIPDSVTSIGNYAFYYCTSLTSITYQGTTEQWRAISKGSGWNFNTGSYTIYYNA